MNIGESSIVTLDNTELRTAQVLATDLRIANTALNTSLINIVIAGPTPTTTSSKPKLSKLELFSGDRTKLRTFLNQLHVNYSVEFLLRYAILGIRVTITSTLSLH